MDRSRVKKNDFKSTPEDNRKVGKCKLNWMEDEENDFQEPEVKKI
jgi:hypothetical protein